MKPYLLSVAVGLLAGVAYGVLQVRSPAPPVVALVGLLGMLGGEQVGKRLADWRAGAAAAPLQAESEHGITAEQRRNTNGG